MGIFSDVTRPIQDQIKSTERLGLDLVRSKVAPVFESNTRLIVEMLLKGARTQIERTIIRGNHG